MIEEGKQEPVIKVGNLDARRSFTDVRDMVVAYSKAIEMGNPGELYLIGTDQIYTIKQCLEMLISFSTMKDEIKYETDKNRLRPTELNILVGDCSKFANMSGWKPTIKFEKTMQDVLDYWRNFVKNNLY